MIPGTMILVVFLTSLALLWLSAYVLVSLLPWLLPLRPLPGGGSKEAPVKVLLVIAHPDDECMFFAPTLLGLATLGNYKVHILCLSTGNACGLGDLRSRELIAACEILQVAAQEVEIVDHPELQDGFHENWREETLVPILAAAVDKVQADVILTFDSHGVSGHPNHVAVCKGVRVFLGRQNHGTVSGSKCVEAWQLVSLNVLRKFCGPLETLLMLMWRILQPGRDSHFFFSRAPLQGIAAMRAHKSQWIWFRWLFVAFASYTYVNTLKRVEPCIGVASGVKERLKFN